MKKSFLFLGLGFISIISVLADDLLSNIVKNESYLPKEVDVASYHCRVYDRVYVGVGTVAHSSVDVVNNAYFSAVYDKAKTDCMNSYKFATTTFYRMPEWSIGSPSVFNDYELEKATAVKFGSWYCSVTGYPIDSPNYCKNTYSYKYTDIDNEVKTNSGYFCKGAIGYGDTKEAALDQMKNNFVTKNKDPNTQNSPSARTVNCGLVGISELVTTNSSVAKPRLLVPSKQNNNELKIIIMGLEYKGSNVRYTCLVRDANGVYSEVPSDGGCKITVPLTGYPYATITAPLLGGVDKDVRIKAQRIHTIEGDEIDDIKRPGVYELSDPITVPKITTTPVVPIPTEVQFIVPPKTPRIEITYYNARNKMKSGIVHDVEETGVRYSCVIMSAVDGHAVPLDPSKYQSAPECSLLKDGTGYSFQVPDSLNGQWFAIKATRGTDDNGPTVFSNQIFLKDPTENRCTYAVKNYSEEGEIGIHCFKIPTSCDAPGVNDINKVELKDNRVNIRFKSTRTSNTSMELFNFKGKLLTLTTPKLEADGSVSITDKIKKISRPYYDYRVYNFCPDKGEPSASYCPVRVYRDPGKAPLICDPKAEKPE